jgi:sugar lactone lactonase YvrE
MIFGYIKCQKIMRQLFLYVAASLLILCESACSKSSSSSSQTQTPKQAIVTTFAGNGSGGFADGAGTSAQFNHPYGLVIDGAGNLYVSDVINNRIRKITSDGAVTTLAGSGGTAGHADGTGSGATFFGPEGLALDPSGNVVIVDATNNRIRKMTSSGVVTTLAGGMEGYLDATGSAAEFFSPENAAIDKAGNIFVSDDFNQRIRKINSAGVVTTFAGGGPTGPGNGAAVDGTGTAARFQTPEGVAFDASGNLFVADGNNNRIRKVTPDGVVTTYAGNGSTGWQDGIGKAAEFANPMGLTVDAAGNLFVADEGNNCIREIKPDGTVTTVAGSTSAGSADGIGAAAQFDGPCSLAFDASGNLYIADTYNSLIRKITFK